MNKVKKMEEKFERKIQAVEEEYKKKLEILEKALESESEEESSEEKDVCEEIDTSEDEDEGREVESCKEGERSDDEDKVEEMESCKESEKSDEEDIRMVNAKRNRKEKEGKSEDIEEEYGHVAKKMKVKMLKKSPAKKVLFKIPKTMSDVDAALRRKLEPYTTEKMDSRERLSKPQFCFVRYWCDTHKKTKSTGNIICCLLIFSWKQFKIFPFGFQTHSQMSY